jgi:hypothetical protein
VSFPSPQAKPPLFHSSGSARFAKKTHVFGYEPDSASSAAQVVEENVSFPSPKAFRLLFRSPCEEDSRLRLRACLRLISRAGRRENVSFPSPQAFRPLFHSSGSARCAKKTHVFGYEPDYASSVALAVEENVSFPFSEGQTTALHAQRAPRGRLTSSATSLTTPHQPRMS